MPVLRKLEANELEGAVCLCPSFSLTWQVLREGREGFSEEVSLELRPKESWTFLVKMKEQHMPRS